MFYYNVMDEDMYSDNQGQDVDDEMNMDMGMDMGMNMRMDGGISPRDMMLEDDIMRAITDEAQAYYYYESLAELAPNDEAMQTIKEIQEDEAKHYQWFSTILRRMGGELPQIMMGETPTDFEEGVKKSIQDELAANEFYLGLAYQATDPYLEMHFMHAAMDEQRHSSMLMNTLLNMM